ncbi:MAG: oxidoreductase [Pseudomonadota bacterium]
MSAKPKIALYWCSSCGGCEESVVDMAEFILELIAKVDIVFWPVAVDTKYADLEKFQDGEITAALINGSIRMEEQEHLAKLLRRKSKLVLAHGSCACLGGVYGLGNFFSREDLLNRAYKEVPSVKNPDGILPQAESKTESGEVLNLTSFDKTVRPLSDVIDVDYYIPGCPPAPYLIQKALTTLLSGDLPPKGHLFADSKALCDSCSRRDSKPDRINIDAFKRIHQTEWDPGKCFLDQGIICLGPSTRGGCEERCIKANFPCRGCYGPTEKVLDQGAKSLSMLASILDVKDEEQLKKIIDSFPDMAGLFYRYSLPSSMLKRAKIKKD